MSVYQKWARSATSAAAIGRSLPSPTAEMVNALPASPPPRGRRGRKPKAARLKVRGNYYYIYHRGNYIRSTGCKLGEKREAERVLNAFLAEGPAPGVAGTSQDLYVWQIFAWGKQHYQDARTDSLKKARFNKKAQNVIAIAEAFFGDVTVSTLGISHTARRYIDFRTRQVIASGRTPRDPSVAIKRNTTRTVKKTTASKETKSIQRIFDEHARARGGPWIFWAEALVRSRREKVLGRNEIARLLWAVRGRVWDAKANAWQVKDVFDKQTQTRKPSRIIRSPSKIAGRKHIGVMIRIANDTGTRENDIRDLRLKPSASYGYVEFRADGTVILHRGGLVASDQEKPRYSTRLPDRTASLFRRLYKIAQKKGSKHFVSNRFGEYLSSSQSAAFRRVAEDAGLSSKVTLHTFRHTIATWLARTAEVAPVDAAAYIGMRAETFYAHYVPRVASDGATAVKAQQACRLARENPEGIDEDDESPRRISQRTRRLSDE